MRNALHIKPLSPDIANETVRLQKESLHTHHTYKSACAEEFLVFLLS